jgi:glutaredoxin-like YruB-family protein
MMRILLPAVTALLFMLAHGVAQAQDLPQSPVSPQAVPNLSYPKIVLFSTSWCPHCKAAKEYFTRNNIPFINRDVELDSDAMDLLTSKYQSQGVPVIVIGDDTVVLKGFDADRFEKAVQKYKK